MIRGVYVSARARVVNVVFLIKMTEQTRATPDGIPRRVISVAALKVISPIKDQLWRYMSRVSHTHPARAIAAKMRRRARDRSEIPGELSTRSAHKITDSRAPLQSASASLRACGRISPRDVVVEETRQRAKTHTGEKKGKNRPR